MTITPPSPHVDSADSIAGTSSVVDVPPATGVQVEVRVLRVRVGELRERAVARDRNGRRERGPRIVIRSCGMKLPRIIRATAMKFEEYIRYEIAPSHYI